MQINFWEIIKNSLPILWKLWPVWVFLLTIVAIRLFFDWLDLEINNWRIRRKFRKGEKWRSDRDLLRWLRDMKPSEFEDYIADLFLRLGYKANAVGGSHDGGIDVVIEKNGIKSYIQCKKFITSKVTVSDVRDFYGALVDHLASGKAYFITTNKFTLEAENFAEDKPIELVDGYKLIRYIKMAKKN
jgi:restriction system protein